MYMLIIKLVIYKKIINYIFILYLPYLTGLDHLCEFIEDCEHTTLAVRIIHLLGREGPRTRHPARYIRFVYNRVILEVHTPLNSHM